MRDGRKRIPRKIPRLGRDGARDRYASDDGASGGRSVVHRAFRKGECSWKSEGNGECDGRKFHGGVL